MARHRRICTLCEAACGLLVDVDPGGRILDVHADASDPLSRGHLCAKGKALGRIQGAADRLHAPMARRGDRWEQVTWEQARREVGERIHAVQRAHGRDAVATYLGNPTVYDVGTLLFSTLLVDALGSVNRYSASSLDGLPHMVAAFEAFGHQLLLPVPDVDRTDLLVVIGANPVVSNGSIMTAPGFARRVAELHRRGGRLVVVDPRRSETARLADRHLPIRPGTDAVLLLAVLGLVIDAVGASRSPHLRPADAAVLRELCGDVDVGTAARATGVPAPEIIELSSALVEAPAAACYGRIGAAHQPFSTLVCWLITTLNLVTGNLDRPGGSMFTQPAVDLVMLAKIMGRRGGFGPPTRARGLPSFGGERPVAALADEIATPGPGQVRALISIGGNLALSAPNGARLERLLPSLDLFVAVDPHLNETTRHAHYVLPPAPGLSCDQYPAVTSLAAVRNVAKFAPAAAASHPEHPEEWRILHGLHLEAVGRRRGPSALLGRAVAGVAGRLGPRRLVALALLAGPYGLRRLPRRPVTLARLRRSPEGVDLGPLVPMLRRRRARLRVVPPRMAAEVTRLLRSVATEAGDRGADSDPAPLRLIGRRQRLASNSWLRGALAAPAAEGCLLLLHPGDAAVRGVEDGGMARVTSSTGAIAVPVSVTDDVAPGVASLPHGWGHASYNDLTDDLVVDEVTGTAAFSGVEITVAPLAPS